MLSSSWASIGDATAIQQIPQAEQLKQQLRDSLLRETANSHAVKISKHANVYTCSDQDETVYFIESGQVKLLMRSPEGRECLLAIIVPEIFSLSYAWPGLTPNYQQRRQ